MNPGFECKPLTPGFLRSVSCNSQTNWSESKGGSQKDMSTSCSLEPVNVALFGKEVFADGLKDLERRSSWIYDGP